MIPDQETNEFVYTLSGGVHTWLGLRRVGPQVDPKPRTREDLSFYFCLISKVQGVPKNVPLEIGVLLDTLRHKPKR